jgi:hypothetical protein
MAKTKTAMLPALFEGENVLLDAVMQQEGTGYSESGHESGDIPRLMARAWSPILGWYFVNHLFAVENFEFRGQHRDVRLR